MGISDILLPVVVKNGLELDEALSAGFFQLFSNGWRCHGRLDTTAPLDAVSFDGLFVAAC